MTSSLRYPGVRPSSPRDVSARWLFDHDHRLIDIVGDKQTVFTETQANRSQLRVALCFPQLRG